jgi:hypothetical protein
MSDIDLSSTPLRSSYFTILRSAHLVIELREANKGRACFRIPIGKNCGI